METWDAIRARRNVRAYDRRPIASEDLDRILEAGRRSPSAGNSQPWDFVLCTDPDQLRQLAQVWPDGGKHVAASAATIALVSTPADDVEQRALVWFDLGQATMSMMLAAADLGIGSGHSGVQDQPLAHRILGLPEERECSLLIAFGYPGDRPLEPLRRPARRPFEEVVHRGRW
jgi:nitroreductase